MSDRFSVRDTRVLDLPLAGDGELANPEQIILRFPHGKTLDVGALCYSNRAGGRRAVGGGSLVDASSISRERIEAVERLILQISNEINGGFVRHTTSFGRYWNFVKFIAWSDGAGFVSAIYDRDSAKLSFVSYNNWLREKELKNKISQNTVSQIQNSVFNILSSFLGLEGQREDFHLVSANRDLHNSTEVPTDETIARVLALCGTIFDGLAKLVINDLPFPHALPMPEYIGCEKNQLWIFPTNLYFISPSMMESRAARSRPNWQYNYSEGRVSTIEEMLATNLYYNCQAAESAIKKAEYQLRKVNSESRNVWRLIFASLCMNFFLLLLLSRSGSNWEQLRELRWSNEYSISPKGQGFREIKWRAKGKRVSIIIPAFFMPDFKIFLEVRRYLLNGRKWGYLFFGLGPSSKGAPVKIYDGVLRAIYDTLKRIDPGLPTVSSRQWRAKKGDWFLRNYDTAAAADALQNTEDTVKKSYASVSEDIRCEEFGAFLKGVEDAILPAGTLGPTETPNAVGACKSMGNPVNLFDAPPVAPDCTRSEGCFFCENYKAHADERDTRKIISCRFCLEKTRHLIGGEEENQFIIEPIFKRIDFFIQEIRRRDAEMVDKVTREVEEGGELDDYWLAKLEMLIELGIVN
ncbi:conserved hypothetical protein [Paraburkholderia tropica]|uniref:hypothetical protein n=1 Tax=Paraburkholderia tropica TaxID=92647 RepID=UPI001CAE50B3|nr:hypothetical protein [Paraburkholderia tropica]CAG9234391.1 conserved hypothetical protein [Paraburkholderia tropica]